MSLKSFFTKSWVIPFFLLITTSTLYLLTLAPTVYWGDTGELITSASVLGVPHPSGYPTYMLIAHAFTKIPLGTIAWRVNLLSALSAALTILVVYKIGFLISKNRLFSLLGALTLALLPLFWHHALIAEIYAFHLFFLALILYCFLSYYLHQIKWYLFAGSFFFGIALTNHLTTIFLLPAIILLILAMRTKINFSKALLCSLSFLVLGFTPLFYIPLRAASTPLWNWGHISNLTDALFHISGYEYSVFLSYSAIVHNFPFIVNQIFSFPALLLLSGTFYYCIRAEKSVLYRFVLVTLIGTLIPLFLYKIPDIETYLLPFFLLSSVLLILSLELLSPIIFSAGSRFFKKRKPENLANQTFPPRSFSVFFVSVILIALVIHVLSSYSSQNLSKDTSARNYWLNIMNEAPSGSIIIGKGTNDLFIPLYLQHVEGHRQDLIIINYYDFTKPWRLAEVQVLLPFNHTRQPKKIYSLQAEAELVAINLTNELINEYKSIHPIFLTFRDFPTKYYINPTGHLNKVEHYFVNYSYMPYPYSYSYTTIKNNEGRIYISRILTLYGLHYLESGNITAAHDALEESTRVNPSFEEWYNLGVYYYTTNNTEQAVVAWKHALTLQEDPQLEHNINLLTRKR